MSEKLYLVGLLGGGVVLYLYWNSNRESPGDRVEIEEEILEGHSKVSLRPPTSSHIDQVIYRSMDSRPLYEVEERIEEQVEERMEEHVEENIYEEVLGGSKKMKSQDSIWNRGELPPIIKSVKKPPPNIAIPDYGKLLHDSRGGGRRVILDSRGVGRRTLIEVYRHATEFLNRDRSETAELKSEKLVPDLSLPDPTQITKDGVVQQIRGIGEDIYDFFTKDRSETAEGVKPMIEEVQREIEQLQRERERGRQQGGGPS